MKRPCLMVCLLGVAVQASAMDLKQAWDLLQYQGPIYRAAVHEKQAGGENRAIGEAGLLPQINASAYFNQVNGSQRQNGQDNDLDYDSKGANVRLRQPLFNKQKMAEYRQGQQRADYSVAVFDAKSQDAAVRLADAYFDVLLASETITLAKAKLSAFEEQLASAKRRMELGAGTITDVDESVARRDLAEADLIDAQDNLVNARRKLEEYIGETPQALTTLQAGFSTPPLMPGNLQEWLVKAQADSPLIHARLRQLRAGRGRSQPRPLRALPDLGFRGGLHRGQQPVDFRAEPAQPLQLDRAGAEHPAVQRWQHQCPVPPGQRQQFQGPG